MEFRVNLKMCSGRIVTIALHPYLETDILFGLGVGGFLDLGSQRWVVGVDFASPGQFFRCLFARLSMQVLGNPTDG